MALSKDEQEISIVAERNSEFAFMYCSDQTFITRMDKLVKNNPKQFSVVTETEYGKTYKFPKRFISIRGKDRTMSEEQKRAAAGRMKKRFEQ